MTAVPPKYQFEEARVEWRKNGGVVNGNGPEYDNLVKVCKKHRLTINDVIPLLLPAVKAYFAWCKQRKAAGTFCESPSSFTVFTNNRRWLREYPPPSPEVNRARERVRQEEKYRNDYSVWISEQDDKTLQDFVTRYPHLGWLVKEIHPDFLLDKHEKIV